MTHFKNIYYYTALCFSLLFLSCEEDTLGDQTFGSLDGKVVTNGVNAPLENVKITTNPASTTVFTDSEGNFKIEDILVGDYSVQAEKDNFETSFEAASIFVDKSTTIIFEMDSTSSSNLQPLVPELYYPADHQIKVPDPVEFIWSSASNDSDDINYTLELRNGSTGETQIYSTVTDTTLVVENLAIGATYFWQVTASDNITTPVQSKISNFQLEGVESNRFLFVRNINGNNVIFSGGEPVGVNDQDINQNEIQLTTDNLNSYRPKTNRLAEKVAFIRTTGGESHLFTMNLDGTNQKQLTQEIPIAGFKQDEMEYAWHNNGGSIYYSNFNRLYTINIDGSGNRMVYEALNEEFITEVATNPANEQIVLKLNNSDGYNAQLRIINPNSGLGTQTILTGITGALGGVDYSLDGNKILYTRDVSNTENTQYRQLDSRIFEYDLTTSTSTELDTQKPKGFNNLDAKYAPNGGYVIFTFTSNDGISEKSIVRKQLDVIDILDNEILFTNGYMPNWE
ncbi:Carboxypeptidase regulatory-like domain-containing protein [Maribacter dokdonensis]|uniref:carboxypeptidase-like regulatory domain-containing protein n=1 Tax=Maribacter dokdonensis TaxID=320912 RepID=UPI001B231A36|nr:carboxypeptidase-like regulatory domain-containing protein [Maribacter dokdonensis]CAG2531373.1 Carboxypeptidase regulatory-like domain-containing protein [Maribacter dokdonensis]